MARFSVAGKMVGKTAISKIQPSGRPWN